jgi:outer membrane receptor protein involved in Fe transport
MNKTGRARRRRFHSLPIGALLASTMLTGPAALAQTAPTQNAGLAEITVTAEKRSESLQNVPISIQALGEEKLAQLNVTEFNDYVKFLPSVSFQSLAPSQTEIYMRGVASGGDGNHSGPSPSVGLYIDEQPITTILGQLDIHIFDIARVESLAGPQGTLYGASSEAGTIRIITNQPDPKKFSASYDVELNEVDHGGLGWVTEGMVNAPITDNVAIRLVAFDQHDSGYIDNTYGVRSYPTSPTDPTPIATINNKSLVKNAFNDVTTDGGRGALRIDLNEDWSITPTVMGQAQRSNGVFGYDPSVGDLQVHRYNPDWNRDDWVQMALTVQGKIQDFDVVYSGGYFIRDLQSANDYSDYSYQYDIHTSYGAYFTTNGGGGSGLGTRFDPTQYILGQDHFTKQSHELRFSSPQENPLRVVAGLFYERQVHDIQQDYVINQLPVDLSVTNWPHTLWLTEQTRTDVDKAVFGEVYYDILPDLTATAGGRVFQAQNNIYGFYGFGADNVYGSSTGQPSCYPGSPQFHGAPCVDLDKSTEDKAATWKGSLTYHIDPDKLVYGTFSTGFRPGGINRNGNDVPPYAPDYLTNYELGWKTSWDDKRLRFNGDVYWETWTNFQFAFLGANSLTEIHNAGQATIKGVEADLTWAITPQLTLSGAGSFNDARLSQNYCSTLVNNQAVTNCANPAAPSGTQLPVTPQLKGNLTARYSFDITDDMDGFVQGSGVYNGSSWPDLRLYERSLLGKLPAYAEADFSGGVAMGDTTFEIFIKNAFNSQGQVYRYAECTTDVCGHEPYIVTITPMTVGFKFGQKF